MPTQKFSVVLDGSGAASNVKIDAPAFGRITALQLSKDGMTANPTVTLTKRPTGQAILTSISVTADVVYVPVVNPVESNGTATGAAYQPIFLEGGTVEITVSGGDADGSVSGFLETVVR